MYIDFKNKTGMAIEKNGEYEHVVCKSSDGTQKIIMFDKKDKNNKVVKTKFNVNPKITTPYTLSHAPQGTTLILWFVLDDGKNTLFLEKNCFFKDSGYYVMCSTLGRINGWKNKWLTKEACFGDLLLDIVSKEQILQIPKHYAVTVCLLHPENDALKTLRKKSVRISTVYDSSMNRFIHPNEQSFPSFEGFENPIVLASMLFGNKYSEYAENEEIVCGDSCIGCEKCMDFVNYDDATEIDIGESSLHQSFSPIVLTPNTDQEGFDIESDMTYLLVFYVKDKLHSFKIEHNHFTTIMNIRSINPNPMVCYITARAEKNRNAFFFAKHMFDEKVNMKSYMGRFENQMGRFWDRPNDFNKLPHGVYLKFRNFLDTQQSKSKREFLSECRKIVHQQFEKRNNYFIDDFMKNFVN